jgi:hypothetical protein
VPRQAICDSYFYGCGCNAGDHNSD